MSNEIKKVEQVAQDLAPVARQAQALVVADVETRRQASVFLAEVKRAQKTIQREMEPVVKTAKAAYDQAREMRDRYLEPFKEAERLIKGKAGVWDTEQDRIRRAEQARLQAEAEERARRERERALKAAEKLKTPELKEQRIAEAESIEAPAIEIPEAPKAEGESYRKIWKARLVNLGDLIQAAAAGNDAARSMLAFDTAAANGFARGTKGSVKVAGVEIYSEKSMAVRV